MIDIMLEPLNNMAFQIFKLFGISVIAFGVTYVIVKTISSYHLLAKMLGLLVFGMTFHFVFFNIFLPGLQVIQ